MALKFSTRIGGRVMQKYYFSIMVGRSARLTGMHNYYIFSEKDIVLSHMTAVAMAARLKYGMVMIWIIMQMTLRLWSNI